MRHWPLKTASRCQSFRAAVGAANEPFHSNRIGNGIVTMVRRMTHEVMPTQLEHLLTFRCFLPRLSLLHFFKLPLQITPYLFKAITYWTFILFALFNFLSLPIVWALYPEVSVDDFIAEALRECNYADPLTSSRPLVAHWKRWMSYSPPRQSGSGRPKRKPRRSPKRILTLSKRLAMEISTLLLFVSALVDKDRRVTSSLLEPMERLLSLEVGLVFSVASLLRLSLAEDLFFLSALPFHVAIQ